MKKTLLTAAVAIAMGVSFSAMADETLNTATAATNIKGEATTVGNESPATNDPSNSYNAALMGSMNTNLTDAGNDINTGNKTSIKGDGNVIHAQNADQAIATSDLDATISGNVLVQDSTHGVGGPGITTMLGAVTRNATNVIAASYSGAAGIAVVSQNTGHLSSIQQSTVVQSNFKLN